MKPVCPPFEPIFPDFSKKCGMFWPVFFKYLLQNSGFCDEGNAVQAV